MVDAGEVELSRRTAHITCSVQWRNLLNGDLETFLQFNKELSTAPNFESLPDWVKAIIEKAEKETPEERRAMYSSE